MYVKYLALILAIIKLVSANQTELFTNANVTKDTKIVGGYYVKNLEQFPYVVSIRVKHGHFCGGSIISKKHVLTAAHCCFDENEKLKSIQNLLIVSGSLTLGSISDPKTQIRKVQRMIVHHGYDPDEIIHDIALLEIFGTWEWSPTVFFIPLADGIFSKNCSVCGWGVTKFDTDVLSGHLQAINVPIVAKKTCERYYGNSVSTHTVLCAGSKGKDSCQGDSGGPLECGGKLVGVVSWGSDCGVFPGVYTNVYEYRQWILHYTRSSSASSSKITIHIYLLLCLLFSGGIKTYLNGN